MERREPTESPQVKISWEVVTKGAKSLAEALRKYYERFDTGFAPLSQIKKLLPDLKPVEFDPRRRELLQRTADIAAGTAAVAIVGKGTIDWLQIKDFDPELISRVREIQLDSLFETSENIAEINRAYAVMAKYRVGDYDGPLRYSADLADIIFEAGKTAENKHSRGADIRTNIELLAISRLFAATDQDFVFRVKERIALNVENNPDEAGVISEALTKHSDSLAEPDTPMSPGDVMTLLQVLETRQAREYVTDYIGDLVATGAIPGIEPITETENTWRASQPREIYRDNLMWAKNMQSVTQLLLEAAPDVWFDALNESERHDRVAHIREHGITNPGGIAMLTSWESQNMIYIGDAPAVSQTPGVKIKNGETLPNYPNSEQEIRRVLHYVRNNYGINYAFEDIDEDAALLQSGSLKRNFTSGGAIFGQFMPVNLRYFIEKYETSRQRVKDLFGIELPAALPGSPPFMSLLMQLYINGQWQAIEGNMDGSSTVMSYSKGGYITGNRNAQRRAWRSWNNHDTEVFQVTNAAVSYYQNIIAPSLAAK